MSILALSDAAAKSIADNWQITVLLCVIIICWTAWRIGRGRRSDDDE